MKELQNSRTSPARVATLDQGLLAYGTDLNNLTVGQLAQFLDQALRLATTLGSELQRHSVSKSPDHVDAFSETSVREEETDMDRRIVYLLANL